jgi:L-ascorbate metabolism protein UlaG (beta-lactamase superfamily)
MRNISRRQFFVVSAGGIAAAYTAACGGDDDDDGGDATTQAPSQPASTPEAAASPTVSAGTDNGAVGLQCFGQAMFVVTSPGGTTLLLDPFNDIGYTVPPPLDTDLAAITHEHPDHNNDSLGGTTARLLRGLTSDGWADFDETVGDIRIRSVRTFHDDTQGSQRGRNTVFAFEAAGIRFAHLGDVGHVLDDAQLAEIGAVDVLMVPVGGGFTIDGAGATEVTTQLAPKMVFPMHYQTERAGQALQNADAFLAGKTVERVGDTTIRIASDTIPADLTAYVLDYE